MLNDVRTRETWRGGGCKKVSFYENRSSFVSRFLLRKLYRTVRCKFSSRFRRTLDRFWNFDKNISRRDEKSRIRNNTLGSNINCCTLIVIYFFKSSFVKKLVFFKFSDQMTRLWFDRRNYRSKIICTSNFNATAHLNSFLQLDRKNYHNYHA